MKNLKCLAIIACILITAFFVGCTENKITADKYYTENNTESYIEILEDDKIFFVNIDFTKCEIKLKNEGVIPPEYDLAKVFSGEPKSYTYANNAVNGYDAILYVDDNITEDYGIALKVYWSKSNVLSFLDITYTLKT